MKKEFAYAVSSIILCSISFIVAVKMLVHILTN